ncbi:hypothetical protein COHA_006984 [Chlorella ohadii]|uniref:SGNH hydrolase-type esterase domain-containing protein n=1 Tax=Chlorella ohadii TaxID=2649997 RepID=A0AAD5H0A7_9CHLO|nr:hypothetical protein COHA_006984 [Chlorella ohadii]
MNGRLPGQALPPRLRVPWQPALSKEERLRGLSYYGSGLRLQRVAAKLLAGQPIKVVMLGGSVTGGGGASAPDLAYAARFFQFVNTSFPHSEHVFINRAIAASTAFLYAPCLRHHVPQDADLVVLEFTVNERAEAPMTSPERRSYEQVIRQLLGYPSQPAVLLLHTYAWWEARGDGLDRGLFYHPPEQDLTLFSHYYDLPSLSLRAATWHLQRAGVPRFKVDRVPMPGRGHWYYAPNGTLVLGEIPSGVPPSQQQQYFTVDGLHPADIGHAALAELLAHPLIRAVWEVQAGDAIGQADRRLHPRLASLPPPMIPASQDTTTSFCAMLEDFKPMVRRHKGFQYAPERPQAADFMHQKWGWRATRPGSWAEIELDTRAEVDQGDTLIWLSHLRSYQGMGTALIECKSGCTCEPTKLDGTWSRRASLFWSTRVFVSRHPQCLIRVTVLPDAGEFPQEGHKVALVAVMVAHLQEGMAQAGTLVHVQQTGEEFRRRHRRLQSAL